MAKARTSQPLVIAVPAEWLEHPKVLELKAQGHTVVPQDWRSFDLIMAPQAHQWNDDLWDYLPAALTAARARKRKGKAS